MGLRFCEGVEVFGCKIRISTYCIPGANTLKSYKYSVVAGVEALPATGDRMDDSGERIEATG